MSIPTSPATALSSGHVSGKKVGRRSGEIFILFFFSLGKGGKKRFSEKKKPALWGESVKR